MNRDMKLENVLMAADGLKIADYRTAICLDLTMKLSFSCCMCCAHVHFSKYYVCHPI